MYQVGTESYNRHQMAEGRKAAIKSLTDLGCIVYLAAELSPMAQLSIIRNFNRESK